MVPIRDPMRTSVSTEFCELSTRSASKTTVLGGNRRRIVDPPKAKNPAWVG